MNFSQLILNFLKAHGETALNGFGVFYLKSTSAAVGADGKSILPPGKEVAFKNDSEQSGKEFAEYVSSHRNLSVSEAAAEIAKQVTYYNSTLEKEGSVTIEDLGTLFLNDSKLDFTGTRIHNPTPDFYGLEEINLSDLRTGRKAAQPPGKKPYKFATSLYWLTALILFASGIAYVAVTNPEALFGKQSFINGDTEPMPQTSQPAPVNRQPAVHIKAADSIGLDTLNIQPARP